MSDTEQHILVDTNDGICTVTFNRPEKKNAFTIKMYEELVAALKGAGADPAVRVVLLQAKGSAFTAGNDLYDFMQNPPTGEDSAVFQFLMGIIDFEKPIVAAVNGAAVGIGVTMLLHCDLVYASETAKFTTPFIPLGLVPEGASSFLLPRIAGYAKANEILLLGEAVDAATAHAANLVTRVVKPEELAAYAKERAQKLAALPAAAVRESKRLLRAPTKEQVKKAVVEEAVIFAGRLGSPEAAEAFAAFFEKRKPDFTKLQ